MRTTVYEALEKEEFYLGSEKVTLRVIPKRTLPLIIWPFFFLYQFDSKECFRDLLQTGKCIWFKDIGHRITL